MLVAATKSLASLSPALADPDRPLLPDVTIVRDISVRIAVAVISQAVDEGLATERDIPVEEGEGEGKAGLEEWVREQMWEARYRSLRRVGREGAGKAARGEEGVGGGRREGR